MHVFEQQTILSVFFVPDDHSVTKSSFIFYLLTLIGIYDSNMMGQIVTHFIRYFVGRPVPATPKIVTSKRKFLV